MAREPKVGDIGTRILMPVTRQDGSPVDLTNATALVIRIRRPGGSLLTKTATAVSPATSGQMDYYTVSGDLNEAGLFMVEGYVTLPTGSWTSDPNQFSVKSTI